MKKIICLIASLLLLSQSVYAKDASDYPQKFWDVSKDHWAFVYIADLADRGVINGYEDGSFKPSKTVTRAEWAKIMVDAAGVQVADNAVYFTDMSNHWANKYVNAAKDYLTGYTDGSYRPDQATTREDVTVAMVRLKGYDLSEVDYSNLSKFKDVDSISNQAKGYVSVAIQNNLISGFEDNTFRGQDTLTRAEAATLLYRAFQHGNADKTVTAPTEPIETDDSNPSTNNSNTAEKNNEYIQQAQPNQNTQNEENTDEEPEEIKPYKVETLAKVNTQQNAQYIYNFAAKGTDSVAYLDDENTKLYLLDTITGTKSKMAEVQDVIEYKDDDYVIEQFIKVFYDNNNDRLLTSCVIKKESDFSDNEMANVLIDVAKIEVVESDNYYATAFDKYYPILFTVDEGFLSWTGKSIVLDEGSGSTNDLETYLYNPETGYILDCIEQNGKLYFASTNGLFRYNFQEVTQIIELDYVPIGGNKNGFFISSVNNSFVHVDFDGKKDFEIKFEDIEILDRKSFDISNMACNLYINTEDEIIFYDKTNSAFRKISKNN